MTNKQDVQVVKAPNDAKRPSQSRNFANMPQLYLELLENKDKIRPTMVNKDYVPDDQSELSETLSVHQAPIRASASSSHGQRGRGRGLAPPPRSRLSTTVEEEDDDDDEDDEEDDEEEEEEDDEEDDEDDEDEDEEEDDEDEDEDEDEEDDDDEEDDEDDDDDDEEDDEYVHKKKSKNRFGKGSSMGAGNGPYAAGITNKLYNILSEDPPSSMMGVGNHVEGYDAPRLSELEQTGQIRRDREIPDFTYSRPDPMSQEEQDELKRDILFKFELLKKSYKNVPVEIPDFTMHSDYESMKRAYDSTVRRVSLDSSVESYKTYLIGGFMVMEFILGHWLKFDMQGFTQQQILNMSSYERLLIELGEKNYVPEGSEWPVELRLLFMIIINAGVFIVSKLIMKQTGTNFMSMMNSMNEFQRATANQGSMNNTSSHGNVANGGSGPFGKRRMRGPNIDVNDLPDLSG